ncbi:MAG TPA: TPM domain-containing protein [Brumimicrobium sp.]|nr:TPM domain-containing protein [Brumimicrobium sp.]
MSLTEEFLTPTEEQQIVQAIIDAENQTSGEIRVHIEEHSDLEVIARAKEIFFELEMEKTNARNGVLFYIGVQDRHFAIIGDVGIDKVVPHDFWDCTKDIVIEHFKKQEYCKGLVMGIQRAGEQLKKYFPNSANDANELPNEITRS